MIYPTVITIRRDDYSKKSEYTMVYRDFSWHYAYKARIDGGWMFFKFRPDYKAWKNQK